jgi:hypothetical protein
MKKMTTAQKISHNRVTTKRRKVFLKRREHVRRLKLAHKNIACIERQLEKIRYRQRKYANPVRTGTVL